MRAQDAASCRRLLLSYANAVAKSSFTVSICTKSRSPLEVKFREMDQVRESGFVLLNCSTTTRPDILYAPARKEAGRWRRFGSRPVPFEVATGAPEAVLRWSLFSYLWHPLAGSSSATGSPGVIWNINFIVLFKHKAMCFTSSKVKHLRALSNKAK